MTNHNWHKVKLKNCVKFQEGYVNPSQTVPEYFGDEIKWLRANDLNNSYVFDTSRHLSRLGFNSAGKSAFLFKPDSLAISKSGTIGRLGILKDYMCGNRAVINIDVDTTRYDNMFIFYCLLSQQSLIEQMGEGSVQKNLYIPVLGELELNIPPLETQKRISEILITIDDNIELNRQTNVTLEAIAQAIFKEWFVNFNFPSANGELVESELGMIPKGWIVGKLGDVCGMHYGKGLIAENRVDGEFPVVGSSGIVSTHNEFLIKGPGIVIGRKGTIGKVIWIEENFYPIDTTFYIEDLLNCNGNYFHYFLLLQQDFFMISSDSAVPGLNRKQAVDLPIIIPDRKLIIMFNNIVKPLFDGLQNNKEGTKILIKIRDTLLPKFMNGEIDI